MQIEAAESCLAAPIGVVHDPLSLMTHVIGTTGRADGRRDVRQTAPMTSSPTTPPTAPVLLDVVDSVATITLNRPDAMNGLDVATKDLLLEIVRQVADDPTVRCVVLTGQRTGLLRGPGPQGAPGRAHGRGRHPAVRHGGEALQPDHAGALDDAEAGDRRGQRRRGRRGREPGLRRRLPDPGGLRRLQHLLRRRRAVVRHRVELDPAAPGRARQGDGAPLLPAHRRRPGGARAGAGHPGGGRGRASPRPSASSPPGWPPARPSPSAPSGRRWRTPPRTRWRSRWPSRPRRWRSPAAPRTTWPPSTRSWRRRSRPSRVADRRRSPHQTRCSARPGQPI